MSLSNGGYDNADDNDNWNFVPRYYRDMENFVLGEIIDALLKRYLSEGSEALRIQRQTIVNRCFEAENAEETDECRVLMSDLFSTDLDGNLLRNNNDYDNDNNEKKN